MACRASFLPVIFGRWKDTHWWFLEGAASLVRIVLCWNQGEVYLPVKYGVDHLALDFVISIGTEHMANSSSGNSSQFRPFV